MNWEIFLGYFTGLRFIADDLPFSVLLGTAFAAHVLDSIMCCLFAYKNGYSKGWWIFLGLIFGAWAVLVLVLLPKREAQMGKI